MKKALRPCARPGCANLTRETYCDRHKPPPMVRRESASWHNLYSSTWWKKARADHLIVEPWCRECAKGGLRVKATDVDHIIPHKGNIELFRDMNNLQSLCHSCHSKKTAWERNPPGKKSF